MAMTYDILKNITIDGVTMGVDTEVGTIVSDARTSVSLSANSWNKSAQVTIPETGIYAIVAFTVFPAASATGTTYHRVGWGNAAKANPNHQTAIYDATNSAKEQSFAWFEPLNKGITIANFTLCSKAVSGCTTVIKAVRLLSYSGGA